MLHKMAFRAKFFLHCTLSLILGLKLLCNLCNKAIIPFNFVHNLILPNL